MKVQAKAINNYREYIEKYKNWEADPIAYTKPEPDYIYTTVGFLDEDVKEYLIKPKEITDSGKAEIEISKYNYESNNLAIVIVDYSEDLEKELDSIIEVNNERFRSGK